MTWRICRWLKEHRPFGQKHQPAGLLENSGKMSDKEFRELYIIYVRAFVHELTNRIAIVGFVAFMEDESDGKQVCACIEEIRKATNDLAEFAWKKADIPAEAQGMFDETGYMHVDLLKTIAERRVRIIRSAIEKFESEPFAMFLRKAEVKTHIPDLERIKTIGTLLVNMLSDLLDGKTENATNIAAELREVEISLEDKSIITCKRDPAIEFTNKYPEIICNPAYARLIVTNIFSNAKRALEQVGKPLEADYSFEQTETTVKIRITDEGCGMAPEVMEKLNGGISITTKPKTPGSVNGLGFQYCRDLARKMGGNLYIERSELGKGTTVVFELKLAEVSS